jgi:nucleoid-associated protein YgaU
LIVLTGISLLTRQHRNVEKRPSVSQNPIQTAAPQDQIQTAGPSDKIQAAGPPDPIHTVVPQAPIQTAASSDPIETTDSNRVIVKGGESLSNIIIQIFGEYDELIEQDILRANPSIKNPNRLFAGQTIILPYTTHAQDK